MSNAAFRSPRTLVAMSAFALAVILAVTGWSTHGSHGIWGQSSAAAPLSAEQSTVTIEVPEVNCAGCSLTVRRALKSVGGVVSVAEGKVKNQIIVTYESAAGRPEAYLDALHKAGLLGAKAVARS